MKRKNVNRYYCVVCRTHTNGAGITSEDGVHVCIDCAETIYNIMGQWHEEHLDHCDCAQCRGCAGIGAEEIEW